MIGNKIKNDFLGENLKRIRKLRGLNKSDLATRINERSIGGSKLNGSNILRYEEGNTKPYDITVTAMAEVLGITEDYLTIDLSKHLENNLHYYEVSFDKLEDIIKNRKLDRVNQPLLKCFSIKELSYELNERIQKLDENQ